MFDFVSGMSDKHAHKEQYPLSHYRKMRKIVRRKKADVEESAENSFSIDAINDISQEEIVETDSEEDDTETDGFFLQPVPIRQRRSLLKLSGVKKVDTTEREECKALRENREECGCDCKTVCDPDTCLCATNGIQCQVDRFSFPCGCSRKGCGNPAGRIEFNPGKVRRHYQHTMGRLEREYMEEISNPPTETKVSGKQNKEVNYTTLKKKGKHIRFSDEDGGEAVEGENSTELSCDDGDVEEEEEYNSTETGCCLDCSLSAPPQTASAAASECSDYAQLSVGCSSPSLSDKLDTVADDYLFGTCSVFSSSDHLALPTSVSSVHNHSDSNLTSHIVTSGCSSSHAALEPISGLLNPILNTMDSLDMYALSHIHNHPQSQLPGSSLQAAAANHANNDGNFVHQQRDEYNDNAVCEWQSLSHESMLTSNNLLPMNDNECSVSSPESYDSSEGNIVSVHDTAATASHIENNESVCVESSLSFTSLKNSSDISFQFPTSHNTAMHTQSEEVEPCQTSSSSLTVPVAAPPSAALAEITS